MTPRVFEIVARTFRVDVAVLSLTTTADDVDGWDSLAHATLLIRLEKAFDVDLDSDEASQAQDLGALIDVIRKAQS